MVFFHSIYLYMYKHYGLIQGMWGANSEEHMRNTDTKMFCVLILLLKENSRLRNTEKENLGPSRNPQG